MNHENTPCPHEHADNLTYFTHEVDGRLHPGWYRRVSGDRVEVFSRTRMCVEFTGKMTLLEQARNLLEQMVREEQAFSTQRQRK